MILGSLSALKFYDFSNWLGHNEQPLHIWSPSLVYELSLPLMILIERDSSELSLTEHSDERGCALCESIFPLYEVVSKRTNVHKQISL